MNKLRFAIVALAFFVGFWLLMSYLVARSQIGMMDYSYSGYPLKFSEGGGMCVNGPCGTAFSPLNLAVDILLWLLVALGLSYGTERIQG